MLYGMCSQVHNVPGRPVSAAVQGAMAFGSPTSCFISLKVFPRSSPIAMKSSLSIVPLDMSSPAKKYPAKIPKPIPMMIDAVLTPARRVESPSPIKAKAAAIECLFIAFFFLSVYILNNHNAVIIMILQSCHLRFTTAKIMFSPNNPPKRCIYFPFPALPLPNVDK